jgi:hypothetical protein
MEWSEVKSRQRKLRLAAAGISAGVLVTMGALTLTGTGSDIKMTGEPGTTPAVPTTGEPTLGQTSKSTTPPSTPPTKTASPTVTATTSEGGWAPAPPPPPKPAG